MKAFYKGTVDVLCKDNEGLISPVSPVSPRISCSKTDELNPELKASFLTVCL